LSIIEPTIRGTVQIISIRMLYEFG